MEGFPARHGLEVIVFGVLLMATQVGSGIVFSTQHAYLVSLEIAGKRYSIVLLLFFTAINF